MRVELNDPSNPPKIDGEYSDSQSREVLGLTSDGWVVVFYTEILGKDKGEYAYMGSRGGYVWVTINGWIELPDVVYKYKQVLAEWSEA